MIIDGETWEDIVLSVFDLITIVGKYSAFAIYRLLACVMIKDVENSYFHGKVVPFKDWILGLKTKTRIISFLEE